MLNATHLMGDVRASVTDVAVHLPHDADVLVTVEQRVLLILAVAPAMGGLVCLETGIGEHDDETLGVLVTAGDGDALLGHQLWEAGWREGLRLCSCVCVLVSHGKDLVERTMR